MIQSDTFNDTQLRTVVVCALFSSRDYARFPGNVILPARESGLPRDSVANVTQIATIERTFLTEGGYSGTIGPELLREVHDGVTLVLSLARRHS